MLSRAALDLLRILAPVMSFTTEEAWQKIPAPPAPSVFLAGFPKKQGPGEAELETRYARLFAVRSEVQKLLEAARRDKQIGASLNSSGPPAASCGVGRAIPRRWPSSASA